MKNKYLVRGDVTEVYVDRKGTKYTVLIDTEDLGKIKSFRTTWNLNINSSGHLDGIRTKKQVNKVRTQYWMHRVINNCPDDLIVDHRNGDVFDNRKENLRNTTHSINMMNSKLNRDTKTGIRNVSSEKGKYRVHFKKKKYGSYETLKKAKEVADRVRKKFFPECERVYD